MTNLRLQFLERHGRWSLSVLNTYAPVDDYLTSLQRFFIAYSAQYKGYASAINTL